MTNFRIIQSIFTDLAFFLMGQLGMPKPPFLSLDIKKNYFTNNFLFRLGYSHAKFKNNPVIFYRYRISPKIGQIGPPKPFF